MINLLRTVSLSFAIIILAACGGEELRLLKVQKSSIPVAIKTTGELTSAQTVEMGPPVVKYAWQHKLSFLIPEGTWVKEGQKIMAFDPQQQVARMRNLSNSLATEKQRLESQKLDNEQEVEELKLTLAEAKMNLDKARVKATNIDNLMARLDVEKLRMDHKIAQANYEMAEYRLNNRRKQMAVNEDITASEVERLTAEVNSVRREIAAMTINAPRSGIVVYIPDNDGNKPAEGDQFTPVHKVLEIPDLDSLIIEATIPEQNAHKVAVGDRVDIRLDAIPEATFTGTVSSLGQIVRVKSREEPSKVFDTVITINNPDKDAMRPGMAARLAVVEKVVDDAVAIPQNAIIYRDDNAYVRVKTLVGESEQRITIVARQEGEAIVTEGLDTGDEVIL